jgi:putative transposase
VKAKKYTEEQIIAVLKEGEAGAKVADLCRKYGMSDASYYNWKAKYAGMTVNDLRRLKALEVENRRLKQIVAEQALDNLTLKELLSSFFGRTNAQDEETGGHVRGDQSWAKYPEGLSAGRLAAGKL